MYFVKDFTTSTSTNRVSNENVKVVSSSGIVVTHNDTHKEFDPLLRKPADSDASSSQQKFLPVQQQKSMEGLVQVLTN